MSYAEDLRFRVLRLLDADPDLSQRQIAARLDVSLGSVNNALRVLIEKGQVNVRDFRASNNKPAYSYLLTPEGVEEKTRLAPGLLRRKLAEYEALRAEIESLERDEMKEAAGHAAIRDNGKSYD